MPLKYLSNFLEVTWNVINCQVELKLKWTNNHLSANGNDNTDADPNDIEDKKSCLGEVRKKSSWGKQMLF